MTFIPQMTSSFHPHIFLLRFSTKTVGKEAKARKIITRYHEVSRRRLWFSYFCFLFFVPHFPHQYIECVVMFYCSIHTKMCIIYIFLMRYRLNWCLVRHSWFIHVWNQFRVCSWKSVILEINYYAQFEITIPLAQHCHDWSTKLNPVGEVTIVLR